MPRGFAAADAGGADGDSGRDERKALASALERAGREGKRVAVVFRADWCPDCRALDAALGDPWVEPLVTRWFHVVAVDVGRKDRNLDLGEELGVPVRRGIPAVAVLEPDGTVVHAQSQGEFAGARWISKAEIASFFRRFAPREGAT